MTAEERRACRTCQQTKVATDFYGRQGARRAHCKTYMQAQSREKYQADNGKDIVFGKSLRRLYGITLDDYNRMAEAQNDLCAMCGEAPETAKRMHVDHDHATGQIRALLCHHCNLLLGNAKDSIPRLQQAIAYLERHGQHLDALASQPGQPVLLDVEPAEPADASPPELRGAVVPESPESRFPAGQRMPAQGTPDKTAPRCWPLVVEAG